MICERCGQPLPSGHPPSQWCWECIQAVQPFDIDEQLAAFDATMRRFGEELLALPEGSPQHAVITAEIEVRISRMQWIIDHNHEKLERWLSSGEIDEELV